MTLKMTVMAACSIVTKEIYSEWISVAFDTGMWPKQEKAVAKQLEKVYLELKALHRANVPKNHQGRAEKFNEAMAGVFDIQTKDATRIANLKASHNGKAVQRRADKDDRIRKELTRKEAAVQEVLPNDLGQSGSASEIGGLNAELSDPEFCGAEADTNTPTSMAFPDVDVRSGTNSIDEKLGRAFIICNAKYRVSVEDLRGIFLTVANIVFGQEWVGKSEMVNGEVSDVSDDDEGGSTDDDDSAVAPKRRRRVRMNDNLKKVLPSRRTFNRWLKKAAILNLQYLATAIVHKKDGDVITCGFDDGHKAAGFKTFDVKAVGFHIKNIKEDGGKRRTLSAGYTENASHSAEDAAAQLDMVFRSIAILTGSTLEEVKELIDFFMTDRAADCDATLEKLGVELKKRVKCCGHIILGADAAIEKVLIAYERRVGVGNLLKVNNARFNNVVRSKSIFGRAQIALAKLLSSSHSIQSVSLYTEFSDFLKKDYDTKNPFKGYAFNRFGRICKSAVLFLEFKEQTKAFFAKQVNENQNLLVSSSCSSSYNLLV